MNKKTAIVLVIAIAVIVVAVVTSFTLINDSSHENITAVNNTTNITNVTNVSEVTEKTDVSTNKNSGAHGYCAICGAALSASEANNEYTQGKVCMSCAKNPYYQTSPGSDYANQKLYDKYPEDYSWMDEDGNGVYDGLEN